ncbi:MAG: hypothetical protein RDU30_00340 [Desulfovibrionaceae bacterium]|nr:hypothetical protein [Desulfovibrionaceae bacterium]
MIENASQTLARSLMATTWPQAVSPDAARAMADTQGATAASQEPARAAQSSPSQNFSPIVLAPGLASLGSEPVTGADSDAATGQDADRERTAADQGRSRYAAGSRTGSQAQGDGPSLDMRV